MNRRGLLALLGGAVALPSPMGAKAAAQILGIDPLPPAPMPIDQICEASTGPSNGHFWGSDAQISLDARRQAHYETTKHDRYGHMKSWSTAFKRSVVQREIQIEKMLEYRLQSDSAFLQRVLEAL